MNLLKININSKCIQLSRIESKYIYFFSDREGTKCPKRPYWGENRIKRKFYEQTYEFNGCLNLRCSVTDATANGKRFQLLTTLHTKLFQYYRRIFEK